MEIVSKFSIRKYLHAIHFTRLDVLVLAVIVVMGLVNLPKLFGGDQVLSTMMALKMSRGEIIYRDLWDLKHPGIFCFYFLGGILFGFDEIGIHTFELLYMTIFSGVLILALKGYFKHRWAASIAPLLTVGMYYGVAGIWHQTQTEALVGVPIFLSLWYASQSSQSSGQRTLRLFLSGFMGGIALVFKFVLLPILGAFWFIVLLDTVIRNQRRLWTSVFKIGIPIILGVLAPLLVLFG